MNQCYRYHGQHYNVIPETENHSLSATARSRAYNSPSTGPRHSPRSGPPQPWEGNAIAYGKDPPHPTASPRRTPQLFHATARPPTPRNSHTTATACGCAAQSRAPPCPTARTHRIPPQATTGLRLSPTTRPHYSSRHGPPRPHTGPTMAIPWIHHGPTTPQQRTRSEAPGSKATRSVSQTANPATHTQPHINSATHLISHEPLFAAPTQQGRPVSDVEPFHRQRRRTRPVESPKLNQPKPEQKQNG